MFRYQAGILTNRIYGGYANGTLNGCLMPEPFAYEEGFAVERIGVAQINGTAAIIQATFAILRTRLG